MNVPVVFVVFNRPDTTAKVFEAIRKARPSTLFVISDAPRLEKAGEAEQCKAVRKIVDSVDWDCEVLKNYAEVNMGCAKRISSGLDWVFEHCQEAIILEDDCLPDPTFFPFCQTLLERYRHDDRVMSISGQNCQFGQSRTPYSYYFSRYSHCWGWATWQRAWQHFDFDMTLLPEVESRGLLRNILDDDAAVRLWRHILHSTASGQVSSWAFRWTFACWMHGGLSVISDENLISNIGFGNSSTNTANSKSKLSDLPTKALAFPLAHPPYVIRNAIADAFVQRHVYDRPWPRLLRKKVRRGVKKMLRQSK